jgi:peptidyl-dipeptidase A
MGRVFRLRNQSARRLGYNDYFSLCANVDHFELADYRALLEQVDSITRPAYDRLAAELKSGFGSDDFDLWDWDHRFANTMAEVKSETSLSPQPGVHILNAPHDVRMMGHLGDGFGSFCALMRLAGTALHAAETSQDSYFLARSDDPTRTESVAAFFEQLCSEPDWLEQYPGLTTGLVTRFARAREGIQLLRWRLLLVDAQFEYEAYRNPNQNLNTLYWRLFEEYTGLPAHDDLTPWAGKVEFVRRPLAAYHKLLGQAAAYQSLGYLKGEYGSVIDNPEVGSFLTHSYFRFGARYDWRELVERATGEKLTPAYIAGR